MVSKYCTDKLPAIATGLQTNLSIVVLLHPIVVVVGMKRFNDDTFLEYILPLVAIAR